MFPPFQDLTMVDKDGPEYLYISFDIDTLDPAFVPGTGTPARWLQAGPRWGILSALAAWSSRTAFARRGAS